MVNGVLTIKQTEMKNYEFYRKDGSVLTVGGEDMLDAFTRFRRLYADSSPLAIIEKGFKLPTKKGGTKPSIDEKK